MAAAAVAFTPSRFQIRMSRISATAAYCGLLSVILLLIGTATGFPTLYKLHPQAADSQTFNYYPLGAGQYPAYTNEDEDLTGDYNFRNLDQTNNYNSYSVAGNNQNSWNVAADPASVYELPEDYYTGPETDPETQWAEIENLSNLLDMYDALNAEQQQQETPTWGHIVNEEPAAELELEELKHKKKPDTAPKPKIPQPSVKFLESNSKVTSPTAPPTPITPKNGQKEIPLLRPPVAAASTGVVNQRSDKASGAEAATGQKASPYDTLRKYLTLEDALKKEAEKRRHEVHANGNANASRQKKSSGFVSDVDSLTSQLNNLKKSVA